MSPSISNFVQTWKNSAGNERANKDSFLRELCEALEIEAPGPKDLHPEYCFEKDLKITHLDGSTSTGSIDLFKDGCFVLEAKQGSTKERRGSSPVRGTRSYDQYMERAFGQAVNYAIRLPQKPPFVVTCDIGHAFHVWDSFSGTYGGYGARKTIPFGDLVKEDVRNFLKTVWTDPHRLDPGKHRANVTRQVAFELGHLASKLEERFEAQEVANFLMRCVFTFFAEDAGLIPPKLFERSLSRWRKESDRFQGGLRRLWEAMNVGDEWGEYRLARFNGGLFADSNALALFPEEIELLHQAARFDWKEVDPSIFGTLLESAFSPEERHALGAHYTPRAFIERLVRPTIEEPLRADWELVQAEALSVLGAEPTDASRAKAREILHTFHRKLATTRILDPACGSGNFLYVAYDRLRRLELEVLSRLEDFGETQRALALDEVMVTPAQFLGIEVKPWAAAIAELVLWIGHLQWWIRLHPGYTPPEPILQRYENIQCRDAVLEWSGTRETGRTRWDGKTFINHPVTGNLIPDEKAQVEILDYIGSQPASWPIADFIVGNPPFVGTKRMRETLGDGYTEALRLTYPDVPDSADFVIYWWHKAAQAVRSGRTKRFGLITTNSLTQTFNNRLIAHHTGGKPALKLLWAIPDHPWTDEGAAVRIAMTVGGLTGHPWLGHVVEEARGESPEGDAESVKISGESVDTINQDLTGGANVAGAFILKANERIASNGMALHGSGFIITPGEWDAWGRPAVIHPYRNGRDIMDSPRGVMVIDLFGLSENQVRDRFPSIYQHVWDNVKPERDQNNRAALKEKWWLFAWPRPVLRSAISGLRRFIVTVETTKHRVFQFIDYGTVPDHMLIAIAIEDAFHLGILSSRIHVSWAMAAGALMGVGNTPRYSKSRCFDPFPFPDASENQRTIIQALAERLDKHRKEAQQRGVTLTQMYNLLEKLKSGDSFTALERALHAAAHTGILRELHDDLDRAVFDAYGWPHELEEAEILERLVTLNRERIEEEKRGLVRWLRPEFQAPGEAVPLVKPILEIEEEVATPLSAVSVVSQPWPKELKEQLAALRALLLSSDHLWSMEEVAKAFKARGRYRESIEAHLGLLCDLGVLVVLESPDGLRFHRPQAVGA